MPQRIATFALAAMAMLQCARRNAPADEPLGEDARFAKTDPRFYRDDPVTKHRCRVDKDCPEGAMCHPGTRVCFSSYPGPGMVDITFSTMNAGQLRGRNRSCILVRVYFPSGSLELVEEARRWLDYDARCLSVLEKKRVILTAHSDALGGAAGNLSLSRRRGEIVKEYLKQKGVDVPIEVIGRGEEDPLMTGDSERDYAFNRRVEIHVD
jgi:outer membrane protein OmpA-like peptidoglycan-associated protein